MTKRTFIIVSVLYLVATALFCFALYTDGHPTLSMAIASLAIISWGCVKIAVETNGFKTPRRKNKPQTF
jgi:hypothetical protein